MSDVKKELIKIAYENPELRNDLIPLISKLAGLFGSNVKIEIPSGEKPTVEVSAKDIEKNLNSQLSKGSWHGVTDQGGSAKLKSVKYLGSKAPQSKKGGEVYVVTFEVKKVKCHGEIVFWTKGSTKSQWLKIEKI